MSGDLCTVAPLWRQLAGVGIPYWAVMITSLVAIWLVYTLWTASIRYNLRLLWEYAAIRIPDISLDDLSASVTHDDGVESAAPAEGTKFLPLQDPTKPGMIQCYDPSTQQWLGQVPAMTAADVHELCVKAAAAQIEWSRTTFTQRRTVLRTMQKYICAHVEEICRVAARDSGKPAVDACLGEVLTTTEKIRTLCAAGEQWLQPDYRSTGPMFMHKSARVEYVPLGVIAPIAPWNYPYVISKWLCSQRFPSRPIHS